MTRVLLIVFLLLVLGGAAFAQCPAVSVTGEPGNLRVGERIRFVGRVDSQTPIPDLKHSWSVNNGRIVKGEDSLEIDVSIDDYSKNLTVTITVSGVPKGCPDRASETLGIDLRPAAIKLDEFVGPLDKIPATRFENIRQKIIDNPNAQIHVLLSGPYPESIKAKRAVLVREIAERSPDSRISFVDVLFKADRVAVWLVPPGADLPNPNDWTAESNRSSACPKISVTGPAGIPERGKPIPFTATVTGEIPKGAIYRWSITGGGEIADGQGTLSLRVWMPDDGSNLTATFEVIGLKSGCPATASETFGISHGGGLFSKPKEASCPTISVTGPAGIVAAGETTTFVATVDPSRPDLAYEWTISNGSIASGQGSTVLKVRMPEAPPVTATVRVHNLPAGCISSASGKTGFVIDRLLPDLITELAGEGSQVSKKILRVIKGKLDDEPHAQLYVILYLRSKSSEQTIRLRQKHLTDRLVRAGIEESRISFMSSTHQTDRIAFWLVPPGANNPVP
ncbi:MAG: Ig-like domain-containing protein [Pyrinomonadaceae bacterium]